MLATYPPLLGLAALFRKYVELPRAAWGKSFSRRGTIAGRESAGGLLQPKTRVETASLESLES
jgi:hypothetical protein